jgi:hypothetical protein
MKIQPTILFKFSHSDALAFEGKAAADFIKLLDQATMVHHEYFPGEGYQWVVSDPASGCKPSIELLTCSLLQHSESLSIRQKLYEAEAKLKKHADMIAAAEQLHPEE